MYIIFIACQLWTVYCDCHMHFNVNAEADVGSTIMEFWTQIMFTLVQTLNGNGKVGILLALLACHSFAAAHFVM